MSMSSVSGSLSRSASDKPISAVPDERGRFGEYGRRYVPETLMYALDQLTAAYEDAQQDPEFDRQLRDLLKHFVGRPNPLYFAERLTEKCGGAQIYFKREDLNHTGAHKINNTMGQVLLTQRMGKTRVIAETGAGQHGVAAATACARFGLPCVVYMGEEDVRRQKLNVFIMRTMGAEVRPVTTGSRTLRDAINEAMRDWMSSVRDTHYIIGSVVGPHPFPMMVRDFQSIIGRETREQCLDQVGRLPDEVIACVGGGSNSAGMFYPFVDDSSVALTGVEAGGRGSNPGDHASTLTHGQPGVLHGSYRKDSGRVNYVNILDDEALSAFSTMARTEGILAAIETSHAIAYAMKSAAQRRAEDVIIVCLSGRGDKDVNEVARLTGQEM